MALVKSEIRLETKFVGSIQGEFYIPSYQRGYRWGNDEVTRLLDDIYSNGDKSYCLQPIVVKRNGDTYEIIDGQQRLTTLFLIYKYLYISTKGSFFEEPKFSLFYETRQKSEQFLQTIDIALKEDNIDFWFMSSAYETIEKWFAEKNKKSTMSNINNYFDEKVKIIWYEVDETEDGIALFERLNIGKIPLTSAELVKAMFLNKNNNIDDNNERQEEISLQWDNIERDLQKDSLWYFLTNHSSRNYQTRIDLILDLMSNKPVDSKEKYYTYFYFDEIKKSEKLIKIWEQIQHTFLILKDWHEDHELYHNIGYLIATKSKSLQEIYTFSKGEMGNITKGEFKKILRNCIKESIYTTMNYAELSYENSSDYARINKLLLLFNVESVRISDNQAQWFPFDKFKLQSSGKVSWSLEHIHAQQSEGMSKQEHWKEWLELHIPSIKALGRDNQPLAVEMQDLVNKQRVERQEFEALQLKVIQQLSLQGSAEYMHTIANLALLNTSDNAALNNSTFDVKRNLIIKMDKAGQFIPFCTKMAFLKYYTPSESNQLHFWGQADRSAYIDAINHVLKDYLAEAITIDKERE